MSRRKQYIDAAGLRADGRRADEARLPTVEFNTFPGADGSCHLTSGDATVAAYVHGPRHVTQRLEARADAAVVTCSAAVASFAGERRRAAQRTSRVSQELSAAVLRAIEGSIMVEQYPGSQIDLHVEVLQGDAVTARAACINAAAVALSHANIAMRDLVTAASAGLLDGQALVDVATTEARSGCPVLQLAVCAHQPEDIVAVDLDARLEEETLEELYAAATAGCTAIAAVLLKYLREETERAVKMRGVDGFVQGV